MMLVLKHQAIWELVLVILAIYHSNILHTSSDTLPTLMNLHCCMGNSSCHLCKFPQPTTAHILNGCPVALQQGRYTYQHVEVLMCSVMSSFAYTIRKLYGLFMNVQLFSIVCDSSKTIPVPAKCSARIIHVPSLYSKYFVTWTVGSFLVPGLSMYHPCTLSTV